MDNIKVKTNFLSSHRWDFMWSGLLLLILGTVYTATLLPGVGNNCDTAKFQFVGRVLGTPHPPGFPTYIFLNYLFTTFFPLGSLAYKANLLSALFSLVFSLLFFFFLRGFFKLTGSIAFITALTFGFTFTLWSQSIVAEVYTLHLLFLMAVMYFFLKWNETRKNRHFFLACALYALSFGNHPITIAYLPAVVFMVWSTDRKVFIDIKKILWVLFFIAISALQYSYFFWRFYAPDTLYIEMATPNLERFFWFVTGAQYKSRMFSFPITEVILKRFPLFFEFIAREYLFLLPLAVPGMLKLKNKTIHIFFLLVFAGNMIFSINYDAAEVFFYLIPNYLIIAIYLGLGLDAIKKTLTDKKLARGSYLFILIPLALLFHNYNKMAPFNTNYYAQKVEFILTKVNKDAIIISPDDYYSQYFWYYLIGEGVEAGKNIYLMHHFSVSQIQEYIDENKPFYLPEQRKYVPPGLKVYCIDTGHMNALKNAGFRILKFRNFLFKVSKNKAKNLPPPHVR